MGSQPKQMAGVPQRNTFFIGAVCVWCVLRPHINAIALD